MKFHTYTYTPDAAIANQLRLRHDACNQCSGMSPITKEKLTNRQWIQLIADELKVESKIQSLPVWLYKDTGMYLFRIIERFPRWIHQYEQDYIFDSSKSWTAIQY